MIFPKGSSITFGTDVIAVLRDATGPSLTRETIDTTSHGTGSNWRTFIKGLKDTGELTFTIGWVPDNATQSSTAGFLADFLTDSTTLLAVVLTIGGTTPAATITWAATNNGGGILTKFTPSIPYADGLSAEVTIKLSGVPAFSNC